MNTKKKYAKVNLPETVENGQKEWKHSVYTCPELGQTCLRPGAYDAFKLPSLMSGVLVYPGDGRG